MGLKLPFRSAVISVAQIDFHQTTECGILKGGRWAFAHGKGSIAYTSPHMVYSEEAGKAVMVGFHSSPAQCWQEGKAPEHWNTHAHTLIASLSVNVLMHRFDS